MPRIAISYDNTHFYKIVCKDPTVSDCYVGHTTSFGARWWLHRMSAVTPTHKRYNSRMYQFMRDNGGINNWEMILLETRFCANNLEAAKVEREWFDKLKPTLNTDVPGRTSAEYYQDKKHISTDCECGGRYSHSHHGHHVRTQKHLKYLATSQCEPCI